MIRFRQFRLNAPFTTASQGASDTAALSFDPGFDRPTTLTCPVYHSGMMYHIVMAAY